MIKYKYIITPLFFLLIFLSACGTNGDTDAIYDAPFQERNLDLLIINTPYNSPNRSAHFTAQTC